MQIIQKMIRTCDPPIYLLVTDELGGDAVRLAEIYGNVGFSNAKQPRN